MGPEYSQIFGLCFLWAPERVFLSDSKVPTRSIRIIHLFCRTTAILIGLLQWYKIQQAAGIERYVLQTTHNTSRTDLLLI